MTRLGIDTVEEPDNLKSNIATAFALQQIKDGKSCNDAKANYKQPSEPSASAIDQTYGFIMDACSSVTPHCSAEGEGIRLLARIQD